MTEPTGDPRRHGVNGAPPDHSAGGLLSPRTLAWLKVTKVTRDVIALLVAVALIVLGCLDVKTSEPSFLFVGVMLLLLCLRLLFNHAKSSHYKPGSPSYVPQWERPRQLLWLILGLLIGTFVAAYGIGYSGIDGMTATATAGDCHFLFGELSGRTRSPSPYSCTAKVTWPDGSTSVLSTKEDSDSPQPRTFIKPRQPLGYVLNASSAYPRDTLVTLFVVSGLSLAQAMVSLVVLVATRSRRPNTRSRPGARDLPPGVLVAGT